MCRLELVQATLNLFGARIPPYQHGREAKYFTTIFTIEYWVAHMQGT